MAVCAGEPVAADQPQWPASDLTFFEQRIRPVLVEKCYRCHSQAAAAKNQLKGGLLLDSRDGLLKGGDSGPAIVPGKADESLLLESLRYESFEMPPDGQLPENTIADFATWIERGAADPRDGTAPIKTRTIDIEAGRDHWAYRPLTVPPTPPSTLVAPGSGGAARPTPIDTFLNARLNDAGLAPLPEADRVILARRLSFDLLGLPPTPEEIDAFVRDTAADAYERFVSRLLESPHFGERWARHWLDVARFAESVTLRGLVQQEAWRYRDYVIDAFNNDMPYDQFLREQIAGDLLPADSVEQRQRQHVATGFLTLTDANLEDQDKEKLRMDVVDEQLNVIGEAILAQTIGCARCHDHKFDPIPQTDYYAMAGILRNTKAMEHANVSRWIDRPLPLPPEREAQVAAYEEQVQRLKGQIAALKQADAPKSRRIVRSNSLPGVVLDDELATYVGQWKRSTSVKPYVDAGYQHDENAARGEKSATFRTLLPEAGDYDVRLAYTPAENRASNVAVTLRTAAGERTVTVNQQRPPALDGVFVSLGQFEFTASEPAEVVVSNRDANGHVVVDAVQFVKIDGNGASGQDPGSRGQDSGGTERAQQQRIKQLEAELKRVENSAPPRPMYQGVQEEAEIGDMHVNVRGDVHSLGELVPRGFLQVLASGPAPEIPADQSGRVQLAEWLADPANPLPARVYVNRVWHWLFGAGLVRTPDNFGAMGQPPSHPDLLDYLAGRFIEEGWSTKALVREIVLTEAYRRQSDSSTHRAKKDPENRLLWRMNRKRLEAECLLDAVLSIGGQLDERIGGKTVPGGLSADYDFQHGSHRRALYWPQFRNSRPELLVLFDGANPSLVTGRRNVSSVAPQALYLMNSPWIIGQSRLAAGRLLDGDALSDSARFQDTFRRTLGRLPTDEEEQTVTAFLAAASLQTDEERLTRWSQLVQSLIGTVDFRYLH